MVLGIIGFVAEFALWAQVGNEWLAEMVKLFTSLGSETFFLLIAPAIYWCIRPDIGLRLGIYLSVSAGVNSLLKLVFHDPRPYWIDRKINPLAAESSFGMPSGHAQNSVVVWGALAYSLKATWTWIVALLLMLAIGLSRVYLGVHSWDEVIVGWVIGAVLLWGLIMLEPLVIIWLKKHSPVQQIAAAAFVSGLFILLLLVIQSIFSGWELPQEWIGNAAAAFPNIVPINPTSPSGTVSNAAIFFGLASGAIWMYHRGGFRPEGAWWHLLLRYLIGLFGVLVIWYGLDKVFPSGEDIVSLAFRYLRYALIGIWISGLAPYIFIKLNLAVPERP